MKGEAIARNYMTDDQVEAEIERLSKTEAVRLARREQRLKYKRRQQLYTLRALEKRGKQLMDMGVTFEALDIMEQCLEED